MSYRGLLALLLAVALVAGTAAFAPGGGHAQAPQPEQSPPAATAPQGGTRVTAPMPMSRCGRTAARCASRRPIAASGSMLMPARSRCALPTSTSTCAGKKPQPQNELPASFRNARSCARRNAAQHGITMEKAAEAIDDRLVRVGPLDELWISEACDQGDCARLRGAILRHVRTASRRTAGRARGPRGRGPCQLRLAPDAGPWGRWQTRSGCHGTCCARIDRARRRQRAPTAHHPNRHRAQGR